MRAFLFILLTVASCQAQIGRSLPFKAASVPPASGSVSNFSLLAFTNNSIPFGAFCLLWPTNYTTNAGVFTVTDLSTNAWAFTNATLGQIRNNANAAVNNQATLQLAGATTDWLRCKPYNGAATHEVWAVVKVDVALGQVAYLYDGAVGSAASRQIIGWDTAGDTSYTNTSMYAGTSTFPANHFRTNKWQLIVASFQGASSYMLTNNVTTATVNPGAGKLDLGMTLFALQNGASAMKGEWAGFAMFNGVLPSTNAGARQQVLGEFTNRFGASIIQ